MEIAEAKRLGAALTLTHVTADAISHCLYRPSPGTSSW